MIAPNARIDAKESILNQFDKEISSLKKSGKYDDLAKTTTAFALKTLTIDFEEDKSTSSDDSSEKVSLSSSDIDRLFEHSGKILGEGLHAEYWLRHSSRDADEVKTEIIVLVENAEAMKRIDSFADKSFKDLYDKYRSSWRSLKEERKSFYNKLARSSVEPVNIDWELPQNIDFSIDKTAEIFDKHLYIDADSGVFKATLNGWEKDLIKEELANGAVAWLRNLDRKKWSLEIPYESNGETTSMFPDLLVIRSKKGGFIYDILEPHDPTRKDNWEKAVGLAKFADKHGDIFGRIQLIWKMNKHGNDSFYRLDMSKLGIRKEVCGITTNGELDRIFEKEAITG
jgi:type III restriction enzyme